MIWWRTLLLAVVCAGAARADAPAADGPPTRAAVAADLLATADVAAAGDIRATRRDLVRTLVALDRIGVRDSEDGHALDAWRARAGVMGAPVERGRVLGPAFRRGWLQPGAEMQIQQLFVGGEPAEIAVAGVPRGTRGVTLSIGDASAGCVGATRQCRWLPLFTQRYTITLRNSTAQGQRFYLVMD